MRLRVVVDQRTCAKGRPSEDGGATLLQALPGSGGAVMLSGRQAVQLGTAGTLPTQLFVLFRVIGEVLIVIVPLRR